MDYSKKPLLSLQRPEENGSFDYEPERGVIQHAGSSSTSAIGRGRRASLMEYQEANERSKFGPSLLISLCCLASHAFFLYGQIAVDWRLDMNATADLGVDLSGFAHDKTWAQLLGLAGITNTSKIFHAYNFSASAGYTIKSFTYMGAITDLWNMFTSGTYIAAVLLFMFSALWPHLKLFFLHLLWYISAERKLRTRVLYWLDTFGKWSLADVFVVCTMLTVLRLQIDVTGNQAFHHIVDELDSPTTWQKILDSSNVDANELCWGIHSLAHTFNATSCIASVNQVEQIIDLVKSTQNGTTLRNWNEPLLRNCSASGPASISLKVVGEDGIYAFCAGAFLSLLTSAYVGHLDRKFRCETSLHRNSMVGNHGPFELTQITKRMIPRFPRSRMLLVTIFGAIALGIVLVASFIDSLERRVIGSVPEVIDGILGADLTKYYSTYDIAHQSAASGGGDYFMMLTFVLFALVGPIVRAIAICATFLIPMSRAVQKKAVRFIDALGSFCGVEVLLIGTLLVIMEIVPVTGTIFGATNNLEWVCDILHKTAFDLSDKCFEVHLLITNAYYVVIASWVCLIFSALFMMSVGYRAVDPVGDSSDGMPTCCVGCPRLSLECLTCWSGREDEGTTYSQIDYERDGFNAPSSAHDSASFRI